jgi:NAD(P)-dependent dehydrogenase (short-subunit alcohol dehydrogenase family)
MDLGLTNKVVIVTGGAMGIGAAIVESFVKEGANVVIADIVLGAAQKIADKMGKTGVKTLAIKTDVTKKSDVDKLVSATIKEFDRIDILVNNAAVAPRCLDFVDIEEEEWDRVNDINAKGVYMVTRAVAPHMIAAKYGKIVNIASLAAKEGFVGWDHYAASKFAVLGLAQSIAKEFAPHNINVNSVCPGIVRTHLWEEIIANAAKDEGLTAEQVFERESKRVPLGRVQTPEDMANMVLFLSSDVSRNVTGEAVNVNGGIRMD